MTGFVAGRRPVRLYALMSALVSISATISCVTIDKVFLCFLSSIIPKTEPVPSAFAVTPALFFRACFPTAPSLRSEGHPPRWPSELINAVQLDKKVMIEALIAFHSVNPIDIIINFLCKYLPIPALVLGLMKFKQHFVISNLS